MKQQNQANLLHFEKLVKQKKYHQACKALLNILESLDKQYGNIDDVLFYCPSQLVTPELLDEAYINFATQAATLISELFIDKSFVVPQEYIIPFFQYQRWINLIFACSPYINADNVLRSYDKNPEQCDLRNIQLSGGSKNELVKFCLMYLPESNAEVNLDTLWQLDPALCTSLCFALQSPRFIGTEAAFSKRAAILQWLPTKLAEIPLLNNLPSAILHDVYMHCSYDIAENKHDVKKALNQVIRRHLIAEGWQDRELSSIGLHQGKPVMIILLEHFNTGHSIYRTHSTSMQAAREHFYTIAYSTEKVDPVAREVFDEFHELTGNTILDILGQIRATCEQYRPAILYMPSIGMSLYTIIASNTRLAPIQAVALGHPGTTHSEFIDYVVVEEDYVGSPACFSETLLQLPKDALPYVPSASTPNKIEYRLREMPDTVHIGIASTTMKLNPYFLKALKNIKERAKVKVHFHFALGQSIGLTNPYVSRFIKSYLGNSATVYPHSPYEHYLSILQQCDMMLNPFPFGNTNGIIDMVILGLVGVCKTGSEVHEHIDEGLFKRLGLPQWLIATTVDEYIENAVRLAENHQERLDMRRYIIENNALKTLFSGDPSPMGTIFMEKLQEWVKQQHIDVKLPSINNKKSKAKSRTNANKTQKTTEKAATTRKVVAPKKTTKTKEVKVTTKKVNTKETAKKTERKVK